MRVIPWLLTALVCLGVTSGLAGIKYQQITDAMAMAESFPPPYSAVTAGKLAQVEWTPVRKLTGTVRAPQFIEVAAEATGRLVALPVAPGGVVEKGDIVFQLFDENLKAQGEALQADLELIALQIERVKRLKAQSLASQDQLDTLLSRSKSVRAQLAANTAQLSRLTLRAPFTGRLGIYGVNVGDLIRAGEVMTTLTDTSTERWIDFKVPQGVARVALGDSVRLLSLDHEVIGEANIIAVADALGSGLRAFDVRATIEDNRLRHGELVLVEVRTRQPRLTLGVPSHAVRWDIEGPHIFVLTDAGDDAFVPYRAQLKRVSLLAEDNGFAYIEGIQPHSLGPDTLVAIEGAFKLSDDSLAKIVEEAPRG